MAKTLEQVREDLRTFIDMAKLDLGLAKTQNPDATQVQFAIVVKKEDGSGQVASSFDCDEFLDDLEALVGPDDVKARS